MKMMPAIFISIIRKLARKILIKLLLPALNISLIEVSPLAVAFWLMPTAPAKKYALNKNSIRKTRKVMIIMPVRFSIKENDIRSNISSSVMESIPERFRPKNNNITAMVAKNMTANCNK